MCIRDSMSTHINDLYERYSAKAKVQNSKSFAAIQAGILKMLEPFFKAQALNEKNIAGALKGMFEFVNVSKRVKTVLREDVKRIDAEDLRAGLGRIVEMLKREIGQYVREVEERLRVLKRDLEALQDGEAPTRAAKDCLLYTSPSPRDGLLSRMPSSA
eukprot:TRINITY_DN5469_c0_g1_i1.p1 TRINITY_DN5469_c0_g1~~TRINITY_DN5469_c0_g1_i1.p1  ORF type:complete len:158 (+),score=49.84 TRINITY_DN5469_c0_g1_i1:60-533(+)